MAYYGKDLRVNLAFSADISAAAANIQKLGKMLENVASNTTIGIQKGPIQEATEAARQLQTHLQNALNVKTGQLNLNKLNESLKTAGTDITTLATKLQYAGTSGQQAFVSLANAIASAETPMLKVNKRLVDFGKTLKNTIKWQAASSAVNMVSSSLTAAVSHAESLNKALNEIRIVTGYSTDSMARFTSSAREAANALSSTTTEYAKAALIFYQQGLSGQEVLERTNTVIKLSNVTGQAVTQSSEQMTAIWNNFYDGSKSLEYYADAMAKLGAATASSTDEIATGLQKFASIAETVGLSYEYATAALATMTSETREASDIVGNALKTIFARMESLKLGDTLDDGVTLGKYSNALKTVGVDILDYKGNLKEMDTILDELGERWQSIGKNQQIALAQTVGGVQQYARFISLMETWDTTKENVELARSAEGTLDEQQAIWSEGWEAASKRAKQSVQTFYENLINDKSITVLVDGFSELVGAIDTAVDSMGGLFGIFLKFGMYFSKELYPFVQNFFVNLIGNVRQLMGFSDKESSAIQDTMRKLLSEASVNSNLSEGIREQIKLSNDLLAAKQKLARESKYMSIAEQEEAQRRMESYEAAILQAQASYALQVQYENELSLIRHRLNSERNREAFAQRQGVYNFRESQKDKEKSLTADQIGKAIKLATDSQASQKIAEGRAAATQKRDDAKAAHEKEYQAKIAEIDRDREIDEAAAKKKQSKQLKSAREKREELGQDLADMRARHGEQKVKARKRYKDSVIKKRQAADQAVADATQAVELTEEKQSIVFQTKKNDAVEKILKGLVRVEKRQGELDFQSSALDAEEQAKLLDAQQREEERADQLIAKGSRQKRLALRSSLQTRQREAAALQAKQERETQSIDKARQKAQEKKTRGEDGYIEATSPVTVAAEYDNKKKFSEQRYQVRDARRQEAINKVANELATAKKTNDQELINKFESLLQRLQDQKKDADDLYVIGLDKLLDSIEAHQSERAKKFLEMVQEASDDLADLDARERTPVTLSPTQAQGYSIAKSNANDAYKEGMQIEQEGKNRKRNAKAVRLSAATSASLQTRRAKNETDQAANLAEKEQLEQQLVETLLNYKLPEDQAWNMDQDMARKMAALLIAEAKQEAAYEMSDELDYSSEENEYQRRHNKKLRAWRKANSDVVALQQEQKEGALTPKAENQYTKAKDQALDRKTKADQVADSEFDAAKAIYDAAEECGQAIEVAGDIVQDASKAVVGKAKIDNIKFDDASQSTILRNALMTNFQHFVEGTIDEEDSGLGLGADISIENYEKANEILATQWGLHDQLKTLKEEFQMYNQPFVDQENLAQARERFSRLNDERDTAYYERNEAERSGDADKLSAAEAKYADVRERAAQAYRELQKAQDQASKSAANYLDIQENSADILERLRAKLKALLILGGTGEGEALEQLLDSLTFDSTSGFQTTIQNLDKMESSIQVVSNAIGVLIDQMEAALKEGTKDFESIKTGVQKVQEQIIVSMNENAKVTGLQDPKSYISENKIKQEVLFDVSQAVSSVMFLNDTLKNLWTSFEDGTNLMEIFSTLLASLPMILPAVSGAVGALTKVQAANNLIATLGTEIQLTKVAVDNSEITSLGALVVAKYANIAAERLRNTVLGTSISLQALSNALMMASVATLAALAVGISLVVSKMREKAEAERQAREEQIQSVIGSQDLIQSWQDECAAMDELIAKYKELNKVSAEYYDVSQDIVEGSQDMAKVFRDMAESLSLTSDQQSELEDLLYELEHNQNPEKVESIIDDANKIITQAGASKTDEALDAAVKNLTDTLPSSYGRAQYLSQKKFERERLAADTFLSATEDIGGSVDNSGTVVRIDFNAENSEEFMQQYEDLLQTIAEVKTVLEEAGYDPKDSKIYNDLVQMRTAGEEQYQSALGVLNAHGSYKQAKAMSDLAEEGTYLSDVDSIDSYLDYKEKYLDKFIFKKSKDKAEANLDSNAMVEKYAKAAHKIELAKKEFIEAGGSEDGAEAFADRLKEYHKTLNDEQQELFLQIDFDTFQSDAAIEAEMERLQAIANRETIDVTIGLIDDALDALGDKGGGSKEDYQEIYSSGLFDRAGFVDFGSFLNFDISDQIAYLEQAKQTLNDMSVAQGQVELNSLLERQAELINSNVEADQKELNIINERIKSLEIEALINEQMRDQNESTSVDLDHSEVEEYATHLMDVAESSGLLDDSLKNNEEAAEDVARAVMRMNRGVENLHDNFKDWQSMLKKSDKASQEYADALAGVSDAIADIANVDVKWITDDFVSENLGLIEKAAEGSAEAIDTLRDKLADDILVQIALAHNVDSQLMNEISSLHENLQAHVEDLRVGAQLDDAEFLAAAQEIINSANMTAQQANEYFRSIGLEPVFEAVPQPVTTSVPEYQMVTRLTKGYTAMDFFGTEMRVPIPTLTTSVESTGMSEQKGTVEVPAMSSDSTQPPKIKSLTKTSSGVMNNRSSANKGSKGGGGGGGGGSKKKADPVKKSDLVERYKEINDAIEDMADAMEDASKASDRLYGNNKIKQMEKQNKILEKEIDLLKKKKQEALAYLEEDRNAVDEAAREAGVEIKFDSNGLISNYTEAMTKLWEELDETIRQANADGNVTDSEQERIDTLKERAENLAEAISQYDETRELIEGLDNEIDDKGYQEQDNNAAILNYKLELNLELSDMELKSVEYYLGKIEDDFYRMAEAAALMSGDDASQLTAYLDKLSSYEGYLAELNESFENGEISQAAYVEGLKQVQDGIYENLEALLELDKSMMEYYGNTLDLAGEEIAKYTDQMEHATSVLEHYANIMETLGKSTNYKAMGIILEAQVKTTENEVRAAKSAMEMYKEQADARYAEYQQALADGDTAAAELYLKQYEAALQAANEAEETYLSKANDWAELLRATLENKLADMGQSLENALTGGTSFDQMNSALERAASLQEEYLTTTNKIYETNKLMRTAQKAIDDSTNTVAKRRLQSFIDETQQLQNQSKLSQYELEIQQAKYDLLLAEIALEEAQNAKSTVRLQRDSEGNFGYVYTADSAQIAQAEQNLADAQNRLYNIALEGANSYAEKYQQTLSEMYDTLTTLQQEYLDGAFESEEEYHAAVEAAKQYYYEKLQQYSSLHTVAITTDSRVIADAWSSDFSDMVYSTEDWMYATDEYLDLVEEAFVDWRDQVNEILEETVGGMDSLTDATQEVVDKSNELTEALAGEDGVIDAIEAQINAVADVTSAYATLRSTLDTIVKKYEEIAEAATAAITAQQRANNIANSTTTQYNSGTVGGNSKNNSGSSGSSGSGSSGSGSSGGSSAGGGQAQATKKDTSIKVTMYSDSGLHARMGTPTLKTRSDATVSKTHVYPADAHHIDGGSWWGYISHADYLKYLNLPAFDTGGYTGSWGSEGRLALLHEKELVLNKGETKDFVAGMNVLRSIVEILDLQAMSAQIGGILTVPQFNTPSNVLEQQVHIEANFPNATDKTQIEDAFHSLVNLASQYGNRK